MGADIKRIRINHGEQKEDTENTEVYKRKMKR